MVMMRICLQHRRRWGRHTYIACTHVHMYTEISSTNGVSREYIFSIGQVRKAQKDALDGPPTKRCKTKFPLWGRVKQRPRPSRGRRQTTACRQEWCPSRPPGGRGEWCPSRPAVVVENGAPADQPVVEQNGAPAEQVVENGAPAEQVVENGAPAEQVVVENGAPAEAGRRRAEWCPS